MDKELGVVDFASVAALDVERMISRWNVFSLMIWSEHPHYTKKEKLTDWPYLP